MRRKILVRPGLTSERGNIMRAAASIQPRSERGGAKLSSRLPRAV